MSSLASHQPVAVAQDAIVGMAAWDVPTTLAAHRRTLEALSASNCAALQGAAAVAAANLQAIRQIAEELRDHLHLFAACADSQVRAARQLAAFKAACEQVEANAEQLNRLIQQAQGSATALLGPRVRATMDLGLELTPGKIPYSE